MFGGCYGTGAARSDSHAGPDALPAQGLALVLGGLPDDVPQSSCEVGHVLSGTGGDFQRVQRSVGGHAVPQNLQDGLLVPVCRGGAQHRVHGRRHAAARAEQFPEPLQVGQDM